MNTIDVMIIEPDRLCRERLRHVFAGTAYRTVMQLDQVPDALAAIGRGARPHLVILDVWQPAHTDAKAVRALRDGLGGVPIVLLTNELTPARVAQLLEAGADAFLHKDISATALARYLDLVMVGEKILPTRIAAPFLDEPDHEEGADRVVPRSLSRCETQIVQHLVDGQPNKLIAKALGITEARVKTHLRAIMKTIRATNRTQVAIWGLNCDISALAGSACSQRGTVRSCPPGESHQVVDS